MASSNLIAAIITTAEVMGQEISESAAKMMVQDLSEYEENEVFVALKRFRQEVKGRLTIADVIQRIDFGHIGAEEAWALCPKSDKDSVVWTEQISKAYFAARPLLISGDEIAARMAFKEAYASCIATAKREGKKAKWSPSFGFDRKGREDAVIKAIALGRLPQNLAIEHQEDSYGSPKILQIMRDAIAKQ